MPDELYDKFSEMAPRFVVQEIPDRNVPEELKIYKEKNWKKNSEADKKVTRRHEGKKDPFVHAPD